MVEDVTLGTNIDGEGIITFVELKVDVEDHDPSNVNEGEEVATIDVEHVEALVKGRGRGGGGFVSLY
jgi:hypothetical protein